jgi:hypothetical protein
MAGLIACFFYGTIIIRGDNFIYGIVLKSDFGGDTFEQ